MDHSSLKVFYSKYPTKHTKFSRDISIYIYIVWIEQTFSVGLNNSEVTDLRYIKQTPEKNSQWWRQSFHFEYLAGPKSEQLEFMFDGEILESKSEKWWGKRGKSN